MKAIQRSLTERIYSEHGGTILWAGVWNWIKKGEVGARWWWGRTFIPIHGRQRQKDLCGFKARLVASEHQHFLSLLPDGGYDVTSNPPAPASSQSLCPVLRCNPNPRKKHLWFAHICHVSYQSKEKVAKAVCDLVNRTEAKVLPWTSSLSLADSRGTFRFVSVSACWMVEIPRTGSDRAIWESQFPYGRYLPRTTL